MFSSSQGVSAEYEREHVALQFTVEPLGGLKMCLCNVSGFKVRLLRSDGEYWPLS